MINYKIATNKDFFQVETDKQGGGIMTATYPRLCQAVAVSDNGFQILEQNGKIFLYNGKIETTKIEGVLYTDVYLFVEKLNEIVYNNIPAVSSTPSTTETLLQEIADNTKVIETKTELDNYILPAGTYTKTNLVTTYGNGNLLAYVSAQANPSVANSKVAITTDTDTQVDFIESDFKGDQSKTIKGYSEIQDFTLEIQGSALVYLTFFKNI